MRKKNKETQKKNKRKKTNIRQLLKTMNNRMKENRRQ